MTKALHALKLTQEDLLIGHLRTSGSITQVEAQAIYKIRSLTRRITTLRNTGYDIKPEWMTDNCGQRYVRYYLRCKRPVAA